MRLTPSLVISGAVGVGKTTVGNEVSTILAQAAVAHTFIDLDAPTMTYPRPQNDRFGDHLALQNLRAVWANCTAAGSRNLIIARVVETMADLSRLQHALPRAKWLLCQLRANEPTLIERVRSREHGLGRDCHEARALELARSLKKTAPADFIVETEGRSVTDIAQGLFEQVEWATE